MPRWWKSLCRQARLHAEKEPRRAWESQQRRAAHTSVPGQLDRLEPRMLFSGSTYIEDSGLVVIEAEQYTSVTAGINDMANSSWTEVADAGVGGGAYVVGLPNDDDGSNTDGARLDFDVDFSNTDTYYAWVRMRGPSGEDDSVHFGIDGVRLSDGKYGMYNNSGNWVWENKVLGRPGADEVSGSISTTGIHTINLWMREDGVEVDRILLTDDANYTPTGLGPASTEVTGPVASAVGSGSVDEGSTYALTLSVTGATASSWSVDWGDGTVNNATSHIYADGGASFTIEATATTDQGPVVAPQTSVTVNNVAPTLSVTGPSTIQTGELYTLNASVLSDPGTDTVTQWLVDWGDGTAANNQLTHTYTTAGPVSIQVSAIDEDGTHAHPTTLPVTVQAAANPTATISGGGAVTEGNHYTLGLAVADASATGWAIDWGDNSGVQNVGNVASETHLYADGNATYTVTATATTDQGALASNSHVVTVANVDPTLMVTGDATATAGLDYTLTVSASDPGDDTLTGWAVDWGDNSGVQTLSGTSATETATHVYANSGVYTVTVTATDEDGSYSDSTKTVDVAAAAATASITASGSPTLDQPFTVDLAATGFTPTGWQINWGDGPPEDITGNPNSVTHTYTTVGSYTISAIAYEGTPGSGSTYIEDSGLVVIEAEQYTSVTAGINDMANSSWTEVADAGVGGGAYVVGLPNDDDGSNTDGARLDFDVDFSNTDTYYAWVRMRGPSGEDDSVHFGIDGVRLSDGKYGMYNNSGNWVWENKVLGRPGADEVSGSISTTGIHTINLWMREDGVEVDRILLTDDANYTPTGLGPASTPASGGGQTNINANSLAVTVTTPANSSASISGPATVDEGGLYTLDLSVIDATATSWTIDWGDGTTPENWVGSTTQATHVYTDGDASHTITATADTDQGVLSTNSLNVNVDDVAPTVTPSVSGTITAGDVYTVSFTVNDPGADTVVSAAIDWGDGATPTALTTETSADHTYVTAGSYDVVISVTNEDGTYSTNSSNVVVSEALNPVATISGGSTISEGAEYTLSLGVVDATATSWAIDWGDGTQTAVDGGTSTATHIYADGTASHTITAATGTDQGLLESNSISLTVTNVVPTITLSGNDEIVVGETFTLGLMASDPGADVRSQWQIDWGDGSTVENVGGGIGSVAYVYAVTGNYTISVSMVDEDGTHGAVTHSLSVDDIVYDIPLDLSATDIVEDEEFEILAGPVGFTVDQWFIDFGNGQPVEVVGRNRFGGRVSFDFAANYFTPGNHELLLTATNSSGDTAAADPINLRVTGVNDILAGGQFVTSGVDYTVTLAATDPATSGSLTNWTINWGDGSTSNPLNGDSAAIHTYANPGDYTVTGTATLPDTSQAVTTFTVTVENPIINGVLPAISASPSSSLVIQEGGEFTLRLENNDYPFTSWTVDWGDPTWGGPETQTWTNRVDADSTVEMTHQYRNAISASSVFTITSTVETIEGEIETNTIDVTVEDVAPVSSISVPVKFTPGQSIRLVNSWYDPADLYDNRVYSIDWGDGATESPFGENDYAGWRDHIYQNAGEYTIVVTATDEAGTYTSTHEISSFRPDEVDQITVDEVIDGPVLLTWDAADQATEYRVERRNLSSEFWQELATVTTGATAYSDSSGVAETRYVYRVTSLNNLYEAEPSRENYGKFITTTGDEDLDGLTNGYEAANGLSIYDRDSDGDQLHDGWEVTYGDSNNQFDPLVVNNSSGDFDNDGLTDAAESAASTNPNSIDTDGDGVGDHAEINNGTDANDATDLGTATHLFREFAVDLERTYFPVTAFENATWPHYFDWGLGINVGQFSDLGNEYDYSKFESVPSSIYLRQGQSYDVSVDLRYANLGTQNYIPTERDIPWDANITDDLTIDARGLGHSFYSESIAGLLGRVDAATYAERVAAAEGGNVRQGQGQIDYPAQAGRSVTLHVPQVSARFADLELAQYQYKVLEVGQTSELKVALSENINQANSSVVNLSFNYNSNDFDLRDGSGNILVSNQTYDASALGANPGQAEISLFLTAKTQSPTSNIIVETSFTNESGADPAQSVVSTSSTLRARVTASQISPNGAFVDANRDGVIELGQTDATSLADPFVFWINNDAERVHEDKYVSESGVNAGAELDSVSAHVGWQHADQGLTTQTIQRDLEDFARLGIWIESGIGEDVDVVFELNSNEPGMEIRFHTSPGGLGNQLDQISANAHILDAGTSSLVTSSVYSRNKLDATDHYFDLGSGEVSIIDTDINPLNPWRLFENGQDSFVLPLMFEGVGKGEGTLTISFYDKFGAKQYETDIHIDLRDVRELYEEWTVDTPALANNLAADATDPKLAAYQLDGGIQQTSTSGQNASDFAKTDEYFTLVHGWRMQPEERRQFADTTYKRLYWQGYTGTVGLYNWPTAWYQSGLADSVLDPGNFNRSEEIAWHSAAGLATLLNDKVTEHGESNVSALAHSMGGVVLSEALYQMAQQGQKIGTAILSQAALSSHFYNGSMPSTIEGFINTLGGTLDPYALPAWFGNAAAGTVGSTFNFGGDDYFQYDAFPATGQYVVGGVDPRFHAIGQAANSLVNFYNEEDFALKLYRANAIVGRPVLNGVDFNDAFPGFGDYRYEIDYNAAEVWRVDNQGTRTQLQFANESEAYEAYAHLLSSVTAPIGATDITQAGNGINPFSVTHQLNDPVLFGFTDARHDHSGQFHGTLLGSAGAYWSEVITLI